MIPKQNPLNKISIEQMAWVFEQLDCGVSLKALAVELGITYERLTVRVNMAEKHGFDAFLIPSARKCA